MIAGETFASVAASGVEEDFQQGDFALEDGGVRGRSELMRTFKKPGVYFPTVRVKLQRNNGDSFTAIKNIDRCRVVVE
jgi:hypothetical protein